MHKFTGALSAAKNSLTIMDLFIINGLQFYPPLIYVASLKWFGMILFHSCVYFNIGEIRSHLALIIHYS